MANVQTAAERTLVANLKRLKVKPKALAEAMGVSESMASMALAGKRGIPIWHLNAIAESLGTTVPRLFDDLASHSNGIQPASAPAPVVTPTEASTNVPPVVVVAPSPPDAAPAELRLLNAVEVVTRLTDAADQLRALADVSERLRELADAITRRQVAAFGLLEADSTKSAGKTRGRAAGK